MIAIYGLSLLVIVLSVALVFSQHNTKEWEKLYTKEKELYEEQYQRAERTMQLMQKYVPYEWRRMYEEQQKETQLRSRSFHRGKTNNIETGMHSRIEFLQPKDGDTNEI